MDGPPVPLSLEPILRCPRCGKPYHAGYVQKGITFPECQKCQGRWWAMLLNRGRILPQLAHEFEDEAIAIVLVETYKLPDELEERRFWQLLLRSKEMYQHRESSPLVLFRSLLLLPKAHLMT
jgi:hypothetical protein